MKFRKKPVIIEAVQWTYDNVKELAEFMGMPCMMDDGDCVIIQTLEGPMKANNGDWIIKGVKGEFYPCKPDIFKETYEKVD